MVHRAGDPGPEAPLLRCEALGKDYGVLTVLEDVTITLPPRGLCGPNGAGKSTLLGIVGGSISPSRGRVLLDGADVARLPPQQRFGLGVSRTFQAVHLIPGRTVLDNVAVACLTSHRSSIVTRIARSGLAEARATAAQTLDRLGMAAISGRDVSSLTLESQRMVELARAIAARPRLLLLDEPASGLSEEQRQAADHPVRPGPRHGLDHRDPRHPRSEPEHPDQRVLGVRAAQLHRGGRRGLGHAQRSCRTG